MSNRPVLIMIAALTCGGSLLWTGACSTAPQGPQGWNPVAMRPSGGDAPPAPGAMNDNVERTDIGPAGAVAWRARRNERQR
jgi:hypothetical protein